MKTSDQARGKPSKFRNLSQSDPPGRGRSVTIRITSKETGELICNVKLPRHTYTGILAAMKQLNCTFEHFFAKAIHCAAEEWICVNAGQGRARR